MNGEYSMQCDRNEIVTILSDMLDNPDESGIYPTSTAYIRLEHYIEQVRFLAIGWAHADACVVLDNGGDPRLTVIPELYDRSFTELNT